MALLKHLLVIGLLVFVLPPGHALLAVEGDAAASADKAPDNQQILAIIKKLEDETQRQQLIDDMKLLLLAEDSAKEPVKDSVQSAAADLVDKVASKVGEFTQVSGAMMASVGDVPARMSSWADELSDPQRRSHWLNVFGRLLAVLGTAFLVAYLIGWLTQRMHGGAAPSAEMPLLARLPRLAGYLLLDLVPIVAFAMTAYLLLTLVDPRQEIRLIAVALINASILSRIVLAASAFLLAPAKPNLRIWSLSDETAHYAHHWVKRLALLGIYGFFSLQAALLLGLGAASYQLLLKLLGLIILMLILVLIAQNRKEMARAIAPAQENGTEKPSHLSSLRKGLARTWHLITGLYLVVVYLIWVLDVKDGAHFVLKATLGTLVVFVIAQLLLRAIGHVFDRGLHLPLHLREEFPGLEQRLNRYFPILRRLVNGLVSIVAILLIASAWDIDALAWFTKGAGNALVGAVFNIFMIVALSLLIWELVSGSIERHLAENDDTGLHPASSARIRTLLTVARNALLVALTVAATLMVLSELGINIAPLLAGAGVVGLAIGFGSQRLVQDVINGAFILFQDLMAVGDVVKLGDKAGVVEALSIRTVRLRDLSGTVHTIPFGSIDAVSNLTRDYAFHVFNIGIAYREDVDEVIDLIKAIGEELQADKELGPLILEPVEVFGLDTFGDSAIVIKGRIKTKPIKQWQVGRAFNRLIKQRFDQQGIEIPFPHTTLYFGQDKQGEAAPMFIQMHEASGAQQGDNINPPK